ncbi:MAG: indolepyruvate oxidoreductase subunit beta [Thermoplasmata archaeon]
MRANEFDVLICGVGGQGIVLVSNVIGDACASSGLRIVTGEQHGLSQRSGSVSIHLRIGPEVRSPLIPVGMSDAILSLESLETLRYAEYLKRDAIVLMNSRVMHPISDTDEIVKKKKTRYFGTEEVVQRLGKISRNIFPLDALSLAEDAGNPLVENIVMLGALSVFESFPVPLEALRRSIEKLVPAKAKEANLKGFALGARASYERFCAEMSCRKPD